MKFSIKNGKTWAGKLAQALKMLTDLAKDSSSVSRTHVRQLIAAYNFRESDAALLQTPQALA